MGTHEQLTLPPELIGGMLNTLDQVNGAPPRPGRQQGNDARPAIRQLRASGMTSQQIATALNQAGIPTASGRGKWWPQTVDRHEDPDAWASYIRRYRYRNPRSR